MNQPDRALAGISYASVCFRLATFLSQQRQFASGGCPVCLSSVNLLPRDWFRYVLPGSRAHCCTLRAMHGRKNCVTACTRTPEPRRCTPTPMHHRRKRGPASLDLRPCIGWLCSAEVSCWPRRELAGVYGRCTCSAAGTAPLHAHGRKNCVTACTRTPKPRRCTPRAMHVRRNRAAASPRLCAESVTSAAVACPPGAGCLQ